jgi:hypothetical protein
MLDPELQKRFARHCADAAFGYSAAGTAACAAFADQVLSFWSSMLQPEPPKRELEPFKWPMAFPMSLTPSAPKPTSTPMMPFNPFAWALPPPPPAPPKAPSSLPSNPWEAMAQFAEVMSGALSAMSPTPVRPAASPSNPMAAWIAAMPFTPPTAAWPMAFMMMSSGVPHAIAWPTAEANAAVLDAAEVARRSIKSAYASYQTDGGHAAGGNVWPPVDMLTLFAMVPLNIGTMLTAMKLH